MISIITLNPLLEETHLVHNFQIGKTFRSDHSAFSCGGKGINISRQLDVLGIKNISIFPLGGNNGKIYRHYIDKEGINFNAISVKGETRRGTVILSHDNDDVVSVTNIIGESSSLEEKEIDKIIDRLDKIIENSSMIVFAGSLPNPETKRIVCYGINKGNELDKVTVLDSYGEYLTDCINSAPMILHNNIEELENSLDISLKNENDKIQFLDSLYKKGIKISALTNGGNPLYANKFGFNYKLTPPKIKEIDATGSGDSFLAGLLYGLEKSLVVKESLILATSLGISNATTVEVAKVNLKEAEIYFDKIKFEDIGKKMKIIDDSPTIK